MAHYNGNKIVFHKTKQALLFSIDTIGSDVVDFINEATTEAEKECGVESSGYSIIFIPGGGMDIMLSFLMMSDNSAIVLVAIPGDFGTFKSGYLKEFTDKIKEAVENTMKK